MRRVVVTGLGAVTPLGVGVKRSWNALIDSRSGVVSLRDRHATDFERLPSRVAGLVPRGKRAHGGWDADEWLSGDEQRRMALFTQYAMAAAEEAVNDSGCAAGSDEAREMMGVCVGSGIGSFEDVYETSVAYDKGGYKKVSPLFVPRLLINLVAGHIAMKYGLQGPNTSPTTACTTGAHALGDAARLISHGSANIMLAGAAESCIHPLAIAGFARARSLATQWNDEPTKASRPFDTQRGGFVIGEGAGIVVLEELSHALARKAPIHAELAGYGLSCDASHMTAPLATGHGAYLSMLSALSDAHVAPGAVGYVNAHATSTMLGDSAENTAVLDVLLGRRGRTRPAYAYGDVNGSGRGNGDGSGNGNGNVKGSARDVLVSSSKGAIGHLLGAAGAVEAIFSILAVREGVLPPTLNLEQPGDADGVATASQQDVDGDGLARTGTDGSHAGRRNRQDWGADYIPLVAVQRECRVALSNSFGFGGTNASLCFTRWEGR